MGVWHIRHFSHCEIGTNRRSRAAVSPVDASKPPVVDGVQAHRHRLQTFFQQISQVLTDSPSCSPVWQTEQTRRCLFVGLLCISPRAGPSSDSQAQGQNLHLRLSQLLHHNRGNPFSVALFLHSQHWPCPGPLHVESTKIREGGGAFLESSQRHSHPLQALDWQRMQNIGVSWPHLIQRSATKLRSRQRHGRSVVVRQS